MKANPLAGTGKVFGFTFRQTCLSKGWLLSTILIAALLLGGIPLIFFGITHAMMKDEEEPDNSKRIQSVLVVDETEGTADYSVLDDTVKYEAFSTIDEAIASEKCNENAIILRVTKPDSKYLLTAYLPENTAVSRSRASGFAEYAAAHFTEILLQKADMSLEEAAILTMPVQTSTESLAKDYDPDAPEDDDLSEALGFLIPFLMLMLVYMMVILYGQSMANSVMLEKTSKLMETILTAVEPFPLMLGKLLATACAAITQIFIWIACGIGGTLIGTGLAVTMLPSKTDMTMEQAQSAAVMIDGAVDNLKSGSYLTLAALPQVLLILALGFLLYLALGAVAGALATKSEDLNKTNVVFVLVLVISMFMCLNLSPDEGGDFTMISSAAWLRYFPFTALLTVPSDLLLSKMSLAGGWVSILCMAAGVVLLVLLAAVVYRLLVLYRGNPPTPKALMQMFRDQKAEKK